MSSLSVLHEDRVQTSLSVNKLTRCYYAMSELYSRRQNNLFSTCQRKKIMTEEISTCSKSEAKTPDLFGDYFGQL